MDRGDWRATVSGIEKESVQLDTIDGLLESDHHLRPVSNVYRNIPYL